MEIQTQMKQLENVMNGQGGLTEIGAYRIRAIHFRKTMLKILTVRVRP